VTKDHVIQTVVVNQLHLYECRRCGRRWLPSQNPDASRCKAKIR
jgi:hypothetical protein